MGFCFLLQASFNLLLYSNLASGETITFKYYHSSSDQIFDLNETLAFESEIIGMQ